MPDTKIFLSHRTNFMKITVTSWDLHFNLGVLAVGQLDEFKMGLRGFVGNVYHST